MVVIVACLYRSTCWQHLVVIVACSEVVAAKFLGSDSRGTCCQHLVVIVACSKVAAAKLRWSLSSPACIVGTCCQHVFVIVACSEVVAAKFLGSDSRGTCCQHLVVIVAKGTKYFQVPFQLWLATDERSQTHEHEAAGRGARWKVDDALL